MQGAHHARLPAPSATHVQMGEVPQFKQRGPALAGALRRWPLMPGRVGDPHKPRRSLLQRPSTWLQLCLAFLTLRLLHTVWRPPTAGTGVQVRRAAGRACAPPATGRSCAGPTASALPRTPPIPRSCSRTRSLGRQGAAQAPSRGS